MRTNKIEVIRVNNDINGNPIFEVDANVYPELKNIGRKKRNKNVRRIQSFNILEDIQDEIGRKVEVIVTYKKGNK